MRIGVCFNFLLGGKSEKFSRILRTRINRSFMGKYILEANNETREFESWVEAKKVVYNLLK